jgi:hypothetical protein
MYVASSDVALHRYHRGHQRNASDGQNKNRDQHGENSPPGRADTSGRSNQLWLFVAQRRNGAMLEDGSGPARCAKEGLRLK